MCAAWARRNMPSPQERRKIARAVEHHQWMLATMKDVDLVAAVDADARDVAELPAVGQPGPSVHDPIPELAAAHARVHVAKCTSTEPKSLNVTATLCPGLA